MKKLGQKKPLYESVQDEILNLIEEWDQTRPLPSEAKLSKDMGVSRNTVREAIQNLEKADVLVKRHGVGTFINKKRAYVVTALNNLHGIQKIVATEGKVLGFKQNTIELVKVDKEISTYLKLKQGEEVIRIVQTYLADNEEIVKGICYLHPDLHEKGPKYLMDKIKDSIDTKTDIFSIINDHTDFSVDHAITKISAIAADRETAESLSIGEGTPIVKLNETYLDIEGNTLMHSVDLIDTEDFELFVVRKRSF